MVTMQPQAITKVSISALVISLPIIYASLLRVPPSTLARDSTFWFLMSNSIIAIIAADSGMLFLGPASHNGDDDHSEVTPGEFPAATVHDDYHSDAMPLPLMPSSHEPTAPVDMSDVVVGGSEQLLPSGGAVTVQEDYYRDAMSVPVMPSSHEPTEPVGVPGVMVGGGEQLPTSGLARSKAADTAAMEQGHAPALIQGEGAAGKTSTDMVLNHASVLQRCEEEEEEAPDLEPISVNKNDTMIVEGDQSTLSPSPRVAVTTGDDVPQDEVKEVAKPWCSVAEEISPPRLVKERDYWQLSDDELNRKVEEFITRFNRDMIEQEAAAV